MLDEREVHWYTIIPSLPQKEQKLGNLDKSPRSLTTTLTRQKCDCLDFHLHETITNNVWRWHSVTFPQRTHVFGWCVVHEDQGRNTIKTHV